MIRRQAERRQFLCAAGALSLAGIAAPALAGSSAGGRLFAAASLRGPLEEIFRDVPEAPELVFAASGQLARQLELGGTADGFISANRRWIGYLAEKGFLRRAARPLFRNQLSAAVPARLWPELAAAAHAGGTPREKLRILIAGARRIALADPRIAPLGVYAREALEHAGLWAEAQPKLLIAANALAALRWTLRGEAEFGLLYRSTLYGTPLTEILRIPEAWHRQSLLCAWAEPRRGDPEQARRIMANLLTPTSRRIWQRHGFVLN